MKTSILLAMAFSLLLASNAYAGWIIESNTTMQDGEKSKEVVYIQDNKMKVVSWEGQSIGQIMIFDIEKGTMCVCMPERKVYFCSTPDELKKSSEEMANKMKEAMMAKMPPEQREAYKKMMEMEAGEKEAAPEKKATYKVKKTLEKASIAGFSTVKHQVFMNGELDQELWLASKVKAVDELDMGKMINMMKGMSDSGEHVSFSSTQECLELMRQGFPIKTVHYEEGEQSQVEEAVRIEKKKIPASELKPPEGYKELTMEEVYGMMRGGH
ncbi:MAG: DUF4412 domain-containing protein [Candidatus Eisenbacteria sp.]|nr:DUF4412 domain-containing protein [Candidatus Eisenbacteria bacterium]